MGKSLSMIVKRTNITIHKRFFSYPSNFIDNEFRKFFPEHISMSPFLPFITDEQQFLILNKQFLTEPTARQSKLATSAATAKTEKKQHGKAQVEDQLLEEDTIEEEKSIIKAKATEKIDGDELIVHYTHEKRFESIKRDMHTVYHDIFKNTPVDDIKMIVGNRNRQTARNELIRKRPKPSILTNQPTNSMYQIIISTKYFHSYNRSPFFI